MTPFRSSERIERLDDARNLAEAGYSVFPCKERGKAPLTANGFKAATRDERQILRWWDRWPCANVGVACEASGITVVDVDSKAGASPAEFLARIDGALVVSWTGEAPEPCAEYPNSLGGQRGAHVWYRGVTRTGHTDRPGVELRSRGAYVLTPGSTHPSGIRYEWGGGRVMPVSALPELPDALRAGAAGNGNGQGWRVLLDPDDELPVSERHEGLVLIAGSLLARGVCSTST